MKQIGWLILTALCFCLLGCTTVSSTKATSTDAPESPDLAKIENPVNVPLLETKVQKVDEEEESEEDLEIYNAAAKIHSILKQAQILSLQRGCGVHVLFQKLPDGRTQILMRELLSARQPFQMGQELKSEILSNTITISEKSYAFWYDAGGNLDFSEQDKIFRVFDSPPEADIVLVPIQGPILKKGMLDIIKQKSQVLIYVIQK